MKTPTAERLTAAGLARVSHAELRREAQAALERGEEVRLLEGRSEGQPVQTVVLGRQGKAGQSLGQTALWGDWLDGRLHTADGGHMLDRDGRCTCQACDLAAGYFGDDDE
ncbi:MAG TPA: hypothetical protein VGK67_07565 [Myxococcales bacterium]|jgi:hypothetical protein